VAAEPIDLEQSTVYERYLAALSRTRRLADPAPPGHEVRVCARCGARALFRIDPRGMWAECTECGRLA
jgi:hypothetical protein